MSNTTSELFFQIVLSIRSFIFLSAIVYSKCYKVEFFYLSNITRSNSPSFISLVPGMLRYSYFPIIYEYFLHVIVQSLERGQEHKTWLDIQLYLLTQVMEINTFINKCNSDNSKLQNLREREYKSSNSRVRYPDTMI